ncbi:hypothetical protein C8R44DRAFT_697862 [Mycena epipterygia]|nr:hypothetical protein C8R44DRAFT_697862 [Mycena epipterygia]
MGNLASTFNKLDKFHEAEELLVGALQKQIQLLGNKHADTAKTFQNLEITYEKLGKLKERDDLTMLRNHA